MGRTAGGEDSPSRESEVITVEEMAPLVRRYSALFAWRNDDRDILAQEALVRAWQFRERYNPRRGSIQQWVFGLVRNSARELWRSRRRDSAIHDRLGQEHVESAADRDRETEDRRRVRVAMLDLSARDQQLLYWRYWEQLPYRDIARLLGCDERAARQAGRRAVARLGRHLR